MKYYALIVAGGSGTRMGESVPKQFLLIDNKPVLMHTIQAFYNSDNKPQIIVALNIDYHQYWENLCVKQEFKTPHVLVKAGKMRFDTVKKGLKAVKGPGIVAIHDAVRPIISNDLITRSFDEAEKCGNAVCAIQSLDSVRKRLGESSEALNRDDIFLVQTPQTFEVGILKRAYKQPYKVNFTDDASVVEDSGVKINLIEGDLRNIKLTYPHDMLIAQLYLKGFKE